jgi:hypothetical protein
VREAVAFDAGLGLAPVAFRVTGAERRDGKHALTQRLMRRIGQLGGIDAA